MMRNRVYLNGRFLTQRVTGVQRFATEILCALDGLLAARGTQHSWVLLVPRGARSVQLSAITVETVGALTGNLWEQVELPIYSRFCPLISFGPTGPAAKVNQVVTMHDVAVRAFPDAYSRSFRAWYNLLLPVLAKTTPTVLTVSEFSKQELVRHYGLEPRAVRVMGEGWEHIRRVPPDESILTEFRLTERPFILAVSSLSSHKNFRVVAEALGLLGSADFAGVPSEGGALESTDFDIVVAGGSADIFQGSLLPSNVKAVGYVSDARLRALYQNASLFIHPSKYEGFGIPPLEAMACGCPVLASNAASIPEVCGDAALYFDPGDHVQLAKLILRVMRNKALRQDLVTAGRARLEHHSWNGAAERYLSFVDEWLGSAATGDE